MYSSIAAFTATVAAVYKVTFFATPGRNVFSDRIEQL